MNKRKLIEQCTTTLKQNDLGFWTRPAPGLYPNQWLWDSCFTAIGLRHLDVKRAQSEIDSLFRGQWKNGMMPHIIQSPADYFGNQLWSRHRSDLAPKGLLTSSITQPPMVAEAMVKVGQMMTQTNRKAWFKHHFNQLLAYHEWLYRERDPHKSGLVALIHPWESGIDNSPSWMHTIHSHHIPFWIKICDKFGFTNILNHFRKDTKIVPAAERIDAVDGLLLYFHIQKVERYKGNSKLALKHSHIALQDVLFNSILIRANKCLREIAGEIEVDLPNWLLHRFKLAEKSINRLWNEKQNVYLDNIYKTDKFTRQTTIGRYLPLYSGAISNERARILASQIKKELAETTYPVASTPIDSLYFNHHRYWQGPTWVNTNWLIIEGLKHYGFLDLAEEISSKTLELIGQHGPYEYFSPIDGTPAGAHQFSWSAALAIDLDKTSE
jgi:hypothetical protein